MCSVSKIKKVIVGNDCVVIGDVSGYVGDGSVVIGATDARGNTIINTPMAVGKGARAAPGSIAIGAYASAGFDFNQALKDLGDAIDRSGDADLFGKYSLLIGELNKPAVDRSLVMKAWDAIKISATSSEFVNLIRKLAPFFCGS